MAELPIAQQTKCLPISKQDEEGSTNNISISTKRTEHPDIRLFEGSVGTWTSTQLDVR